MRLGRHRDRPVHGEILRDSGPGERRRYGRAIARLEHVGAAADLAACQPALEQEPIGAADRADGDVELEGQVALGRQALARPESRLLNGALQATGQGAIARAGLAGELDRSDGHEQDPKLSR